MSRLDSHTRSESSSTPCLKTVKFLQCIIEKGPEPVPVVWFFIFCHLNTWFLGSFGIMSPQSLSKISFSSLT